MIDYVICSNCGKKVSNSAGVEMTIRAYVKCPECIEKEEADGEVTRLTNELKQADKNYLDLKNEVDERVQAAREEGEESGYEEATKRAIDNGGIQYPLHLQIPEHTSSAARHSCPEQPIREVKRQNRLQRRKK